MDGCGNFCVGTVKIGLYNLREKWGAELRQRKNPYNFRMAPLDLRCNHVFYMCPRPVVLVTVEHEGAGNMPFILASVPRLSTKRCCHPEPEPRWR